MDFATARRMMVDGQIRTRDVFDLRLLAAFREVPRERFVPEGRLSYVDLDVPLDPSGRGRRLLRPMVLARLLQAAEITAEDRVLDVGCATGYSSALLARIAAEVVGLEEDADLSERAQRALRELAAAVTVVRGALSGGWPPRAPYDVIVVEGAVEFVPRPLLDQLADGGRLVCILGAGPAGKGMVFRSVQGEASGRPIFDAAGPLLPGFAKPPAFVF